MKHEAPIETGADFPVVSERQSEIAELVRTNGVAGIDELASHFGVSAQTIRKDVNGLCDLGLLRRFHGGVQPVVSGNLQYQARQVLHLSEKQRVAAEVARAIPDGASIAVSIGTTPEMVVRALTGHRRLKIFTNNLHVAMIACQVDTFEVTMPGGALRPGDGDILGASAVAFFGGYKVDFGIFGVAAVDHDGGLLDFHDDEVAVRQAILRNSRESFLVLDDTKFSRRAHVRGGQIRDVSCVFCNAHPPASIANQLQEAGVPIRVSC